MDIKVGEVMSTTAANLLRCYITTQDRADISRQYPVSASTLRDAMYRRNAVSENSFPAIKALIKLAESKATLEYNNSKNNKKDLKKILDTI